MRRYRIIEDTPGRFLIQRKGMFGWRSCDRRYYPGLISVAVAWGTAEAAKLQLAKIVDRENFRGRVVHEVTA